MIVLSFQDVDKSFTSDFTRRKRPVLRGVSFEVQQGETLAYLGHNGAGKTTSIKALLGLIKIDGGRIELFGRPPGHRESLARIGYVPEKPYFYDHLTGREFLQLVADLHGVERREARARIGEVLELVSMQKKSDQRMRTYSKGMLQRIGLGQALINDPDLLVLDEPMGGLDPMGRHHIRTIVGELKERGKTILMSSHILADVEAVADRAAILSEGALKRMVDLRDRAVDGRSMEIQCRGLSVPAQDSLARQGLDCERSNDVVRVRVTERDQVAGVIQAIQDQGGYLLQVAPVRMDLERIFLAEVGAATVGSDPAGADEETREHVRRILDNLVKPAKEPNGDREEVLS